MKAFLQRNVNPLHALLSKNQNIVQRYSTASIVNNLNIDQNRVLSFRSLKKARRIIEFFSNNYMHHHNMKPSDSVRYIDHLMFTESLVYLVDDENEKYDHRERKLNYDFSSIDTLSEHELYENINRNQALSALFYYLKQYGFHDTYTHEQVHNGVLYYKMEQYLCNVLEKPNLKTDKINKYLVDKCNSLRSFDLRLMNLITYKLTKQIYNDDIIKFMYYVELHFEISEDLSSYEKDVLKNTFNIYRMYVNLYQNDAELHFEKYYRKLAEQLTKAFNELLIKYPESMQKQREMKTLDLVFTENTPTEFHIARNWSVPKPILNEHNWRKAFSNN